MYSDFLERARQIVAEHKAQYQGVYVMFGGGSPSGSTTTTQNTAPWAGQQPYLQGGVSTQYGNPSTGTSQYGEIPGALPSAASLYANPSDYPQYYPSSTVAPLNSTENSALGELSAGGSALMNQDEATQQAILSGSMLSGGNPYQQNELNAENAQITPQIESQFTQGNSMNNPAAAYATAAGIGSADAGILGQNYNNAENQLTQTSLYAPQTYNQQLQGENAQLAAGQVQQNQSQQQLNNQVNAYNYNQALPYNMLSQYEQMTGGNYGGTSSLTSPYYNNTASNILSGGLGLAGLASSGAGSSIGSGLDAIGSSLGESLLGMIGF